MECADRSANGGSSGRLAQAPNRADASLASMHSLIIERHRKPCHGRLRISRSACLRFRAGARPILASGGRLRVRGTLIEIVN